MDIIITFITKLIGRQNCGMNGIERCLPTYQINKEYTPLFPTHHP